MNATPKYLIEFPDFRDMPTLPDFLEDISWNNDSCPSFRDSVSGCILFVEYFNPADREYPESSRFEVITAEGNSTLSTDNLRDALAFILAAPRAN